MYALFELDEHYNMPLYEVANPEDPTEKHIAVGFDPITIQRLYHKKV